VARHEDLLRSIRVGVFGTASETPESERRAAFDGELGRVPEAARAYLQKVRERAYTVTDEDVAALRKAGLSEDAIYDLTIAAALGASWKGLEAGWRALLGGKS
jgi:alkylhydroperoxidase family enzyme